MRYPEATTAYRVSGTLYETKIEAIEAQKNEAYRRLKHEIEETALFLRNCPHADTDSLAAVEMTIDELKRFLRDIKTAFVWLEKETQKELDEL